MWESMPRLQLIHPAREGTNEPGAGTDTQRDQVIHQPLLWTHSPNPGTIKSPCPAPWAPAVPAWQSHSWGSSRSTALPGPTLDWPGVCWFLTKPVSVLPISKSPLPPPAYFYSLSCPNSLHRSDPALLTNTQCEQQNDRWLKPGETHTPLRSPMLCEQGEQSQQQQDWEMAQSTAVRLKIF